MTEVALGAGDSGGTRHLQSGDTIEISLPENPTTGYRWSLEQCDTDLLEIVSNDFEPEAEGAIGSGGRRVIQLRAKGVGSSIVQVAESRQWESAEPQHRFEITLEID